MKYIITILLLLPLLLNAQLPSGYGRSKIDYTQVPGTMLWLNEDSWQDASSQIPADGQKVVKVVDQSETPGNDFTQANVNYQGRIRHDALGTNRKALDLDGVEDYYESTTEYLNAPMTVFLAAYTHETTEMDNAILWCGNTDQNGFGDGPESHISLGRNGDLLSFMMGSDSLAGSGGSVYPYKYHRVEELSTVSTHAVIVSGGTNAIFTYNGGIVKIDGGVLDNADGSFFNANRTILGHPNTLARLYDGYIFELVIWNRAIPQDSVILMLQSFHEKFNQKVASPVTPPSTQEYIIRDPSQVKGLVGWWNPDGIRLDGALPTDIWRWDDMMTTDELGNNYWRSVYGIRPTAKLAELNGYDVVYFDSTEHMYFVEDTIFDLAEFTIISVVKPYNRVPSRNSMLLSSSNVYNDGGTYINCCVWDTGNASYGVSSYANLVSRLHFDSKLSHLTSGGSGELSGTEWTIQATIYKKSSTIPYPYELGRYRNNPSNNYKYFGEVAEIMLFNKRLETSTVRALVRGLKEKYGL